MTILDGGGEYIPDAQRKEQGPVEILCREIGFDFDKRMERTDIFVAFVSQLVDQIADRMELNQRLATIAKVDPTTDDARDILVKVGAMLTLAPEEAIAYAAQIHERIRFVMPDEGPCDHNIDMLSSCVSAIRFGLESPCRSRHAAEAASHVWKHVYGVSRFDSDTPAWRKQWSCKLLQSAILSLLPSEGAAPAPPVDHVTSKPNQPKE